ncbi:MAG TPA: hypothetical protein DCX92_09790 [Bacteroidetes bacterium]|nr:hypothetical protein [Bacteroidota bacterium]HRE10972.1 DUF1569 domain-containing protein [Ignavibacteria bacterium]
MIMHSIYNKEDNQRLIERIRKINSSSKPAWGKLDAAGMLFHLQEPIRVSLGEINTKQGLLGKLLGKMALKEVLSDKPFKKGVPTSDEFKPKSSYELDSEKEKLLNIVSSLCNIDQNRIGKNPHPFFGLLSPGEWGIITWKHIDHHLTQFGV